MIVKKIVAILLKFAQDVKWKIQIQRRNDSCVVTKISLKEFSKVLYIVPHSDDEFFGGEQLISNNITKIKLFYCGLLGSNKTEENANRRRTEFTTHCKKKGFSYYASSEANMEQELLELIQSYQPDIIFMPSYVDWHDEHRYVNELVAKYCIPYDFMIGWYQISVPIPISSANHIEAVAKEDLDRNKKLFYDVFYSQKHMLLNRFFLEQRYVGKSVGVYAAERFVIMSKNVWKKNVEFLQKDLDRLDSMKSIINNLYDIYVKSRQVYEELILYEEDRNYDIS